MKKGVCTYCGSNVEFSGDQSEIVCPYCREQIKTQKAEKRFLELQRERRRAIAFLVNFIVFGIGTIFIIGCFSGKEFTILPYAICLVISIITGILFFQLSNNKYVIEIVGKFRKRWFSKWSHQYKKFLLSFYSVSCHIRSFPCFWEGGTLQMW